jgi:hypothetical protein
MADDDVRVVATAANLAEAELIRQRLQQEGIEAVTQRSIGGPEWGPSGAQYVYVEPKDLERAQELLSAATGISDAELDRLAEEAGPPPPD